MTIMPAIARTLKERFGLEARLQDPHLAVAKGAALFALMKKMKVSMPADGTDAAPARAAARQVAEQLGISADQVKAMFRKQVATVVPRAFGIKVIDSTDPVFATDQDRAARYIAHLLTANTPLPADTGPGTFRTITDNQREVCWRSGSRPAGGL